MIPGTLMQKHVLYFQTIEHKNKSTVKIKAIVIFFILLNLPLNLLTLYEQSPFYILLNKKINNLKSLESIVYKALT